MMVCVSKNPVKTWFMNRYLDWQRDNGRAPLKAFARFLRVSDKSLNHWMGGRNRPSYSMAVKICTQLNDYSLLDLLEFELSDVEASIDFLPSDMRERLRLALLEIGETLITRSIQPESTEAAEISTSVLKKYGFRVTEIEQ